MTLLALESQSPASSGTISFPESWKRRHLLDLESLSEDEIVTLLDTAERLKSMPGMAEASA